MYTIIIIAVSVVISTVINWFLIYKSLELFVDQTKESQEEYTKTLERIQKYIEEWTKKHVN